GEDGRLDEQPAIGLERGEDQRSADRGVDVTQAHRVTTLGEFGERGGCCRQIRTCAQRARESARQAWRRRGARVESVVAPPPRLRTGRASRRWPLRRSPPARCRRAPGPGRSPPPAAAAGTRR